MAKLQPKRKVLDYQALRTTPLSRPFTFDRVMRIIFTLVIIVGAIWFIDLLKSVLLPFCVAWLIAYMLEPFVQYNRRLLGVKKRLLPVFVTLFETLLIIILLGILLVPSIAEEAGHLSDLIKQYAESTSDIPFIPDAVHDLFRKSFDLDMISESLRDRDIQSYVDMAADFLSSGYDVVMGIFNWFLVLLYVVFIMLDYDYLIKAIKRMIPPKYREVTFAIGGDIKRSMNHYFRGQALVAFCVGVLFSIGFLIIKMPMAIVLGMFIGLLNMVPYLQLISLIPTTLLCIVVSVDTKVDFWTIWWECMAVYAVVQCIQDLFLTPRIMGKVMGLNPAIILLSLGVWGTLLGFIGLIIALPLTTLLLSYYNMYITTREDDEKEEQLVEKQKVPDEGDFE